MNAADSACVREGRRSVSFYPQHERRQTPGVSHDELMKDEWSCHDTPRAAGRRQPEESDWMRPGESAEPKVSWRYRYQLIQRRPSPDRSRWLGRHGEDRGEREDTEATGREGKGKGGHRWRGIGEVSEFN